MFVSRPSGIVAAAMMKPLSLLLAAALGLPLAAFAKPAPLLLDTTHSRIAVDVKATVDSFTAHLSVSDATIIVDPDTGQVVSAHAAFNFLDLKTGKTDRDRAMHEWQETPKYPTVVFALAMLTPLPDGTFLATGDFTLHGQTRRISFPTKIDRTNGNYTIDAEAKLDTRDFGLPVIRKFAVLKVTPELRVRLHLEGHLNAS